MSDDELIFFNVRLEQHAGVTAALAEEIPLAEVLAQEGIAATEWSSADTKWKQALAGAPDLQLKYAQKRRQAEDALGRDISPISEDPVAWAGLLAAVNLADDSKDVLKPLGLRATDLSRLGRKWSKRADKDPEVHKQLSEAAGKSPAPKTVKADPVKLMPFPWTKGHTAEAAPTSSSPSVATVASSEAERLRQRKNDVLPIEEDVDLYAAYTTVLQLCPQQKARALVLCGTDEVRMTSIATRWKARLAADPDLQAEHTLRVGEHRESLRKLLAGAPGRLAVAVADDLR